MMKTCCNKEKKLVVVVFEVIMQSSKHFKTMKYWVNVSYGLHKKLSQFDNFWYLFNFHASW